MLALGWHLLDDLDTSPALPCATFLDIAGRTKGMESPLRLCRIYFKGQPATTALAPSVQLWGGRGCRVQIGNEPNLPDEGFGETPNWYARWFADIKHRCPNVLCYLGAPSPNGTESDWYEGAEQADGLAVHAYGAVHNLIATVRAVIQRFPEKPIWVSEVNFGAGNVVNLDDWVANHFHPFLDWCSRQPTIEAVTYFARRWDQSPKLPMSLDGAGTAVERLLRTWRPPESTEAPQNGNPEPVGGTTMPEGRDSKYSVWVRAGGDSTLVSFLKYIKETGGDPILYLEYGFPVGHFGDSNSASPLGHIEAAAQHLNTALELLRPKA